MSTLTLSMPPLNAGSNRALPRMFRNTPLLCTFGIAPCFTSAPHTEP